MKTLVEILELAGYEPLQFRQIGRAFTDAAGNTVYAARYYPPEGPRDVEVIAKPDGSWHIDFGPQPVAAPHMYVMGGK